MTPMRSLLMFAALLLVTSAALTQRAHAQQEQQEPSSEPPSASPYLIKVAEGVRLAAARDFTNAQTAFGEAMAMDAGQPLAHYFAGETHRMNGALDQALASFEQCQQLSVAANNERYQGLCTRGQADTLERMEGRLEDARTKWREYVQFADAHRAVSNPEVGRARIQAIDVQQEQANAYAQVRERIAERERVNAEAEQTRGAGARGEQQRNRARVRRPARGGVGH